MSTEVGEVHKNVAIELTRRRFLCSMFAFLTAESILLIVGAIFAQSLYLPVKAIVPDASHTSVAALATSLFLLLFWQMIVASFWGLFYWGDRLHQPDQ
jgi:multisubunit Na+/H+ antiporter MnhE subunit